MSAGPLQRLEHRLTGRLGCGHPRPPASFLALEMTRGTFLALRWFVSINRNLAFCCPARLISALRAAPGWLLCPLTYHLVFPAFLLLGTVMAQALPPHFRSQTQPTVCSRVHPLPWFLLPLNFLEHRLPLPHIQSHFL